ncbi:MAG: LytR C-terminal domain-containing protein [Candidatus Levybacteria bacterium]|nr:LytR C-terminal domain-containing protein [Candidatus Levybacteria bacterium]
MADEFPNLSSYTNREPSSPKKKAFLYVSIFVLLIGGAIFFGNYFLSPQRSKQASAAPTSVPTVTPTPTSVAKTVTPSMTPKATQASTPSPTGKKTTLSPTQEPTSTAKLRIEVLNGSGKSGAASVMASFLKEKGYLITSAGNADTFDYQQTEIQIKKSKSSNLSQLKKDLSSTYEVASTVETLAESSSADAIVIVGAE